jgi:predicted translin family RNA/ssDNA-binding protein
LEKVFKKKVERVKQFLKKNIKNYKNKKKLNYVQKVKRKLRRKWKKWREWNLLNLKVCECVKNILKIHFVWERSVVINFCEP